MMLRKRLLWLAEAVAGKERLECREPQKRSRSPLTLADAVEIVWSFVEVRMWTRSQWRAGRRRWEGATRSDAAP